VAHEILVAMDRADLLPPDRAVPLEATRIAVPDSRPPELALRAVEVLYRQYLIMRQYDSLDLVYERYVDLMTAASAADPRLEEYCARKMEIAEKIQVVVMPYRDLLRAEKLGLVEQRYTPDEAHAIYSDYIGMIRAVEAPEMPMEEFLELVPRMLYRAGANSP
jgi:hypothetical protein